MQGFLLLSCHSSQWLLHCADSLFRRFSIHARLVAAHWLTNHVHVMDFLLLLSLASGGSGTSSHFISVALYLFLMLLRHLMHNPAVSRAVIFCKFSAVWCNGKGCKPVPLIALRNVLNISLGSCNALGVSLLFHRCLYFCIDREWLSRAYALSCVAFAPLPLHSPAQTPAIFFPLTFTLSSPLKADYIKSVTCYLVPNAPSVRSIYGLFPGFFTGHHSG